MCSGRKTDVQDSEWLCKLLRSGLVRGSFIPPKEVRELRELTRYKRKLIQTITAEKQRVEKILEDANIKLSSIASDTFGTSGARIIQELLKGELRPDEMARLRKGKLRRRKPWLYRHAQRGSISTRDRNHNHVKQGPGLLVV